MQNRILPGKFEKNHWAANSRSCMFCTACGDTPADIKITKQPASVVVANGEIAKVTTVSSN